MFNECPKVPKSNIISKYTSYAIISFILYILITVIGIIKNFNLYFSYFELLVFLLFLIFDWIYLLGFLIISIFFNLIQIVFMIGILVQNKISFNSNIFNYSFYIFFLLLDLITINILFTIRKEGKALLLEQKEGNELQDISNKSYYASKEKKEYPKKGYIPFSGKGTVVG